ncbi:MAG: hypothetical protein IID32_00750 [Planctomycetes bacterium]|nr:hypothetical protein [Planctomycetota bacterium]
MGCCKKAWEFVRIRFHRWISTILSVLFILAFFGIIAHLLLALEWVPNFIPELFDSDIERHQAVFNDILLLIGLLLAFCSYRSISFELLEVKRKFRKDQGIDTKSVKNEEEALDWMLEHYLTAKKITIFAGAFEWIVNNERLLERIQEVASKGDLKLISYRDESQIRKEFENKNRIDVYEKLKGYFYFKSNLGDVKCTITQEGLEEEIKFLYRSKSRFSTEKGFNTCVMDSTDATRELLGILKKFTDSKHWEGK